MLIAHPQVEVRGGQSPMSAVKGKLREWVPGLVLSCAAFHVVAGLGLGLAPDDLVVSAGTRPVLDLLPKEVWGAVFVAAGILVYVLFSTVDRLSSLAIRTAVLFVAGTWFAAFALAVVRGEGNILGLIIWPFLYGPWLLAMRSLRKR